MNESVKRKLIASIIMIVILSMVIVLISKSGSDGDVHMEADEFYDKVYKLSNSAFDCKKSSSVKEKLSEMEDLYERIDNRKNCDKYKQYLQAEIHDVRDEYEDRVFCEWQEKADKALDCFILSYIHVIDSDPSMFTFAALSKSKKDCLRYYEKYWSLKGPEVYLKISPQDYMKKYLGENYDFCMQSHLELERKLESAIEAAKPEKQRGEKLTREMIAFVKSNGSVKRSELKKHEFQGFNCEEVAAAYKYLLKKYRLVEYKIGNLYFVSLPEKSQSPSHSAETETLSPDTKTG